MKKKNILHRLKVERLKLLRIIASLEKLIAEMERED